MTSTVQINERGSLTLPKAMRKALGLDKGGVVMVEEANGQIILRPAVSFPVEIYSDGRVAEFDQADEALRARMRRSKRVR